ncbi:putative alcohol dehydrogenase [Zopfia rhizophila CBS 207.26]|uniref:Putative alcohol dehydrogenase n=1 Tax=Zopfia rhizophila CBS 207.26 TaxID=1314779 RepID=A0A6A6DRI1_9PEZI|nr:putative alcohol dehydrogenase [Zopfia rhizophila CBS 207.26]
MSTQQALIVTSLGQPITSTTTRPIPQPGPNQVQLRVTVAGLNPHDQKARDGGLFIKDALPAILANDVAGVVTALGPNATKFNVGDRVFSYAAMTPDHAQKGLQQYALVDEDFTAKVPEGFTEHDVTTLPVNIIAGSVGLFHESGLGIPAPWSEESKTFDYAGTQILIIGGGSNCGRLAVQLAKLAGIEKIVVVGGKQDELKKFGATHVLDRHGGDEIVLERIREVVGDDLLYCYDAVNPPESQFLGINALSNTKKGKLARLVFYRHSDTFKVVGKKAGYEVKDVFGSPHLRPELSRSFWKRIEEYLIQGNIVPTRYVVEQGLDAAKVNEVLDRYRDGKPVTQTHFRISD